MTQQELIRKIESFAKARGLSPSTVTGRGVGNSKLYSRLKGGKSCTFATADRLAEYIDAHQHKEARP